MKIIITPRYENLFDGPRPDIDVLLSGIPSVAILHFLAMINAELFANKQGVALQARIFDLATLRQPKAIKDSLLERTRLQVSHNNGEEVAFFSAIYCLEFIHYELTHFRDIPFTGISAEQDLDILKAYFLIIEGINNTYVATLDKNTAFDQSYFYKITWPTFLEQFEINQRANPYTAMIKGIALFVRLQSLSTDNRFVNQFLKHSGEQTAWAYIQKVISVLLTSQAVKEADGFKFANFAIPEETGLNTLLDTFSIELADYDKNFKDDKKHFLGIRQYPLYKLAGRGYLALNWNFLSNKLYDGLLYDFYNYSGIATEKKFKDFPKFKQYVSEEVTEGYLFRKVLASALSAAGSMLQFDEKQMNGHPDCYFRKGNNVLLIEIKDAYFPMEAVTSLSFESIKAAIDLKYNSEAKGTGQIVKQLNYLQGNSFEPQPPAIPSSDLNVFPVIIYTDGNFNLPGINDYLTGEFSAKLNVSGLAKNFKTIRPLTFININFFIDHFQAITDLNKDIFDLIDGYHQELRNLNLKFENDRYNEIAFMAKYQPFEKVIYQVYRDRFAQTGGYLKSIEALSASILADANGA